MSRQEDRRRPVAYTNARLLDPASGLDTRGGVLVDDGHIADVGEGLFADGTPEAARVVDCAGICLAPGLVDMRVQLREPGEEHKETIATAGQAAAVGGVTSMIALPNTHPVVDDVAGVEYIARRARELRLAKVYTYAAVTRGLEGKELTELGLLSDFGARGFTDGLKAVADAQVMRRALSYACAFDAIIIQHPEEPSLADGVMNAGAIATRLGLAGIPAVAEVIMIERDLRLVELTGGRYHAAHLSTAAAVEAIRQAKVRGLPVTCDTAPPYFTLTETDVGDYRTFAKVSPPLRTEADREAIEDGLADGTIDAIASDHSPHDQDSKRLPFAVADAGIAGLETLLALSLTRLHHGRGLNLLDVLGRLTCGPAAILRLEAGRLQRGAPADLVLFDPEAEWTIDPDRFRSKSKNAPFENTTVRGQVLQTIVDGRTIYESERQRVSSEN